MKVPRISEAEWHVMKVLWMKAPLLANEIIDELGEENGWKPKTVKTLISRLVAKNAVSFDKMNRAYRYYPLVSEDECVKAESQSFLKRVYGGALRPLIANFLEQQELSSEEIEELRKLLDQKKK